MLRFWGPMLRRLFPSEVDGLENIPHEPCLFISNHNISAAVEIIALIDFWQKNFKDRAVYGLAHTFAFRVPGFREYVSRMGAIPATYESAYQILNEKKASLIIFPGGNREACRPIWEQWTCDFSGHYGWARIALTSQRKVVPVSISGSHEVNPVFFRSQILGKILIVPRLLGLTAFPVSLSQIFFGTLCFFLVFGLTGELAPGGRVWWLCWVVGYCGFIFTPLTPTLPRKLRVHFGKPVDLVALTSNISSEREKLEACYIRIQGDVQAGLDRFKKEKVQ